MICEPGRRKGQGSFACLADTNGDGAFDHFGSVNAKSYGYGSSTQIGFLVGTVKIDGWTAMDTAVTVSSLTGEASPETMEMTLTLASSPAKWPKNGARFMLCADRNEGNNMWGAPIVVPYCTRLLRFGAGETGVAQPLFLDSSLTVHAATGDAVEVSIDGLVIGASI
ncbi:MAG: hypothetical protein H6918_03750 [Sphingomonadaceae bacterium]|nr:hypothetical protein [Sphingomonadaceae bacterium]